MVSAVEKPIEAPIATRNRWWWIAPLLLALGVFAVLASWLAYTKAPWSDEGWFANPAYNLAFRGYMGMNVLEPSGFHLNAYFRGIQQHTYLFPPNHMVALAGWFKLFGAAVFTMRLYSILWSAVGLVILFYLFSQFFSDRRVAVLATFFTAIDFIFLWSSADGRTEGSANALALCAVAAYVYFRGKNFRAAVVWSQIFGAAAAFIHPNAAVIIISLGVVAWRFDRERFQMRDLFLACAPYLVFALLWGWYIWQSPGDFLAQFLVHAAGHHSERLRNLFRPDVAIGTEIARQFTAYYLGGLWGGVMKGWMTFIPLLYLPAVIWFFGWSRSQARSQAGPVRMFTTYAAALLLAMTFLNGFKGYFYLIYLVPVYNAMFAACVLNLWDRGKVVRSLAIATGLAFITIELSISILHIRADEYHRDYEPTIAEMARDRAEGKSIVGTSALGFGLGFSGFHDDLRLGMYSGLDPDVVVIDRSYRNFARYLHQDEPAVFAHNIALLATKYRLTAKHGSFWIFERAPRGSDGKSTPWIDPRQLAEMIEKERE